VGKKLFAEWGRKGIAEMTAADITKQHNEAVEKAAKERDTKVYE
jgi:hypothetical protein